MLNSMSHGDALFVLNLVRGAWRFEASLSSVRLFYGEYLLQEGDYCFGILNLSSAFEKTFCL